MLLRRTEAEEGEGSLGQRRRTGRGRLMTAKEEGESSLGQRRRTRRGKLMTDKAERRQNS